MMIEWKLIKIDKYSFIGVFMQLPRIQIYVIYSTKCILLDNKFNIHHIREDIAIVVMKKSNSFIELLESEVVSMNAKAEKEGYYIGMSGKEVLLYKIQKKNNES